MAVVVTPAGGVAGSEGLLDRKGGMEIGDIVEVITDPSSYAKSHPDTIFVFATTREAYLAAAMLFPDTTNNDHVAIADQSYVANCRLRGGIIERSDTDC